MYSTLPYIYSIASLIHGYPPEAGRDVVEDKPGWASWFSNKSKMVDEATRVYKETIGVNFLFNTLDYEPTTLNISSSIIMLYIQYGGGSPDDMRSRAKEEIPIFKEHLKNKTFYPENDVKTFLLNNLLRMYRQEPLKYDKIGDN